MGRISSKLTYANVVATTALFAALGGGAYAASSFVHSGGVVDLCVTHSGAVQVLAAKKSACGKGASLVAVNQRGVTGARGPAGPAGTGSADSAGYGLSLSGTSLGANLAQLQARIVGSGCGNDQALQSVAQSGAATCAGLHAYSAQAGNDLSSVNVVLPPGHWAVFGQMTSGLAGATTTRMTCQITVNGSPLTSVNQDVPSQADATLPVIATTTTTAGGGTSVATNCFSTGAPIWSNGTIIAIPLAALN